MKFQYNDGGRSEAGYKGKAGDCVTRSIAIITGKPYQEVYDALNNLASSERRKRGKSSARTGVHRSTYEKYILALGMKWTPTMKIGQGCKVHLCAEELPAGRLIVAVSRHLTAVIDGVIHDTHNPQREAHCIDPDHGQELKAGQWRNENGICSIQRRCVYGYYSF